MIYVVKAESFLRTPLISILMEGEDWMVGFDEIFNEMAEGALIEFQGFHNYPAARISTLTKGRHQLEIDLDGFRGIEPRVEIGDGSLIVTGTKTEYASTNNENYLQSGVSARGFRRSYQLSRETRVVDTDLRQGILQIALEQAVPSTMEPVSTWVRAG